MRSRRLWIRSLPSPRHQPDCLVYQSTAYSSPLSFHQSHQSSCPHSSIASTQGHPQTRPVARPRRHDSPLHRSSLRPRDRRTTASRKRTRTPSLRTLLSRRREEPRPMGGLRKRRRVFLREGTKMILMLGGNPRSRRRRGIRGKRQSTGRVGMGVACKHFFSSRISPVENLKSQIGRIDTASPPARRTPSP
jgi:hypothetical protein